MKIGEIYFIRERDRVSGKRTNYVKIGIVSDTERGSSERLTEHQTGNPRDLELHHVTQTPSPFRVEKFLHQRFGGNRVRSEWFALTDEELSEAVQVSERLAKDALTHVPVIDKAAVLARTQSAGDKIPATSEATEWHQKLMAAKHAVGICKDLKDDYKQVAIELSPVAREEAEQEELVVSEDYVIQKFDEDGFSKKHPTIHKRFIETSETISGRFTPSKLSTIEADPELVQFSSKFLDACDEVRQGTLSFGDLFDLNRDLEMFEGSYQWDETIADAHLRALCGDSPGIVGLCTWNRSVKTKSTFDRAGLENAHPKKYEEFVTRTIGTRLKTRKRSRRKAQ